MASALGMGKKPSPEEIRKRQGQVSKEGKAGDTMKVRAGSATGSGLFAVDPRFDKTGKIITTKSGQKQFWVDANEGYRWDPVRQRYKAIDGYGRGYVYLDPVQQASSGGGGKGGGTKAAAKKKVPGTDGVLVPATRLGGAGSSPGLTTSEITGMSPELINNPQYGVLNWIHQLNPNDQVPPDLGMYVENDMNPGFTPVYPKGVLV